MRHIRKSLASLLYTVALCFLLTFGWRRAAAQEVQQKGPAASQGKNTEKGDKPEKTSNPAQIELLEYRVARTVSHHPLAPDFWLEHTFDRSGVVQKEDFVLDLPGNVVVHINPETPADSTEESGEGEGARNIYHWRRMQDVNSNGAQQQKKAADITLSTLDDYGRLGNILTNLLYPSGAASTAVRAKAD